MPQQFTGSIPKDYSKVICYACYHYHHDCPLSGMTDMFDAPLEGTLVDCIHFVSPAIVKATKVRQPRIHHPRPPQSGMAGFKAKG